MDLARLKKLRHTGTYPVILSFNGCSNLGPSEITTKVLHLKRPLHKKLI
jgi:hypothetical protein